MHFRKKYILKATYALRFMCNHIVDNTSYVSRDTIAKVTSNFNVVQSTSQVHACSLYTVNVVVSRKRCKMVSLLLQINRK